MKLSRQQALVLYALGEMCQRINARVSKNNLEAYVTKAAFIHLVQSIKLFSKKQRALYKNLEVLETKKIINYDEKKVMLTNTGQRLFTQLTNKLNPYMQMREVITKEDLLKYTNLQTSFKTKL